MYITKLNKIKNLILKLGSYLTLIVYEIVSGSFRSFNQVICGWEVFWNVKKNAKII